MFKSIYLKENLNFPFHTYVLSYFAGDYFYMALVYVNSKELLGGSNLVHAIPFYHDISVLTIS